MPSFLIEERGLKFKKYNKIELGDFVSFLIEERGLKYPIGFMQWTKYIVVPHRGTWIEIHKNI